MRTTLLLVASGLLFGACNPDPACVEPPPLPVHPVRIEGHVALDADVALSPAEETALAVRVWARNVGADTARIQTGPCAFRVLAYPSDAPAAELIWHNLPPETYVCPDVGHLLTIAPGARGAFANQHYLSSGTWPTELPAGRWYFVVEAVTETDSLRTIPAGYAIVN